MLRTLYALALMFPPKLSSHTHIVALGVGGLHARKRTGEAQEALARVRAAQPAEAAARRAREERRVGERAQLRGGGTLHGAVEAVPLQQRATAGRAGAPLVGHRHLHRALRGAPAAWKGGEASRVAHCIMHHASCIMCRSLHQCDQPFNDVKVANRTTRFGTERQRMVHERGALPYFRSVRVAPLGTAYNRGKGNRRAWRNSRVSSPPCLTPIRSKQGTGARHGSAPSVVAAGVGAVVAQHGGGGERGAQARGHGPAHLAVASLRQTRGAVAVGVGVVRRAARRQRVVRAVPDGAPGTPRQHTASPSERPCGYLSRRLQLHTGEKPELLTSKPLASAHPTRVISEYVPVFL